MLQEQVKFTGNVNLVLRDAEGQIKQEQNIKNMVVTAGKDYVTSRMIGTSKSVMSYMGVGTSNTAAATGQTDLQTSAARSNTSFTAAQSTTTTTNDTVTYTCVFGAGVGTGSLVEAGLFNAASGGDMLARTVFGVITKGASDSLTITWKITAA